jgi:hypothetical protein
MKKEDILHACKKDQQFNEHKLRKVKQIVTTGQMKVEETEKDIDKGSKVLTGTCY